jgi:hypothetical protein
MTPDGHPATPARLHPETAVICAGRPTHTAGGPLNVPVVLASNFHAGTGERSRAYSRTDATPGWEAPETAAGQMEGGRIIAPEDCYFVVGELLADAQQQGRWAIARVDLTDTASVQAAVAGADLLSQRSTTPQATRLHVIDVTQMSYQNSNHSVSKNLGLPSNPQVTRYKRWGERGDSNPRHPGPQPGALTN